MLISRVGGVYSNCVDEQDAKVLQDSIIYNEMYPKTNYSQAVCGPEDTKKLFLKVQLNFYN